MWTFVLLDKDLYKPLPSRIGTYIDPFPFGYGHISTSLLLIRSDIDPYHFGSGHISAPYFWIVLARNLYVALSFWIGAYITPDPFG